MSGEIAAVAKTWLTEPRYIASFKLTSDVFKDYLCNLITMMGSIVLAVNFLASMGTGPVNCMLKSVLKAENLEEDVGPFPNAVTLSMVNYANYNQRCADASLTWFLQYLGFFLLVEAVSIILIEKMLIKMPRISGKYERFYVTIVEDALFGKDTDAIEDVMDWRANAEAISRRRRKNEICEGLKRSSIISKTYIYKNIVEICLLFAFIVFNIFYGLNSEKNLEPGICVLKVSEIPNIGIEADGFINLLCEGKRVSFYLKLLYLQTAALLLILLCCLGSLIWYGFFRNVSQLLNKMEKSKIDWDVELETNEGQDFLFLFDLLAHTSGIEATLRVLSHADETFRKLCLPKLSVDQVRVEEEKLKVYWKPASIETWLEENDHKGLQVECYVVTIFPKESINTSFVTKIKEDRDKEGNYSAWFYDLQGGKTEYVLTIACVLGRSRMKGEQVFTSLLPWGPEVPRAGLVKSVTETEIEIEWEPPKREFTKYILGVDPNVNTCNTRIVEQKPQNTSFYSNVSNHIGSYISFDKIVQDYTERELSNLITNHKISGLKPGETYGITLKTMTGGRPTRRPIMETVLTKPLQVEDFMVGDVKAHGATVTWVVPPGHKRLRAFRLMIVSCDGGPVKREMAVKHNADKVVSTFTVDNIPSASVFTVTIKTVCVFETLRTISEEKSLTFTTIADPPTSLSLDNSTPSSLTVRWEAAAVGPGAAILKFRLTLECGALGLLTEHSVTGDKNTFNFSKLPDVVGSGQQYSVTVCQVVSISSGDTREVISEPVSAAFTTKPLAPRDISTEHGHITITPSPSPSVQFYKLKYKRSEEGAKAEEIIVKNVEEKSLIATLKDLISGPVYKINVTACVEDINKVVIESKPLHEKIILTDGGKLSIFREETQDKERRSSVQSNAPLIEKQVTLAPDLKH